MNRKSLKNRLNSEIAALTPDVLDDVVESSYIEKPAVGARQRAKKAPSKRLTAVALSCCAVLIVAGVCTGLILGLNKNNPPVSNATYVTMSVENNSVASAAEVGETDNPSVSFTADSENTVETVRADNEGGKQILATVADSQQLKGKKLHEATELVVDAAARIGYIDVTATADTATSEIKIKIASTADVKINDVLSVVKSNVQNYLKKKGIYAYVSDKAYTKEELVAEINIFDKSATLSSLVSDLTEAMAKRKPYYEEAVSVSSNADITLLSEYVRAAVGCVDEFINDYQSYYLLLDGYLDPLKTKMEELLSVIDSLVSLDEISDVVVSAINAAKGIISNTVSGLLSMVPEVVKNVIGSYVASVPSNVNELGEYLEAVANRHAEKMYNQFKDAYDSAREPISDEAYIEFSLKFSK